MKTDVHHELVNQIVRAGDAGVRALLGGDDLGEAIDRLGGLQKRYGDEFPILTDQVEFWETLWSRTDLVRDQWVRMERAANGIAAMSTKLQKALDEGRRELYQWTRRFICEHAPVTPERGHFELGITEIRADRQGLHQRLEGLYESVKRIGRFPTIREGTTLSADRLNLGIVYGGGWNVSTYSILREAVRHDGMNTFVAFDHPGKTLYGELGSHIVRLADAAMMRLDDRDEYILTTLREPVVLHFVCPHRWTGRPAHELGIPVLRSDLTIEIVNDKLNTSRALQWYADKKAVDLPLIHEQDIGRAAAMSQVESAIDRMQDDGIHNIVIKPTFGEESQGVEFFTLPQQRAQAVAHAGRLALDSEVVVQEEVSPPGGIPFSWRVLVSLAPDGRAVVSGRFARIGLRGTVEMVNDRQMLDRVGITGSRADAYLARLNDVSINAFQAVAGYAQHCHEDFPHTPLGGGSYATPYFLGIDLIGDAQVMEVNGNEVAGMWTDDRLYPQTAGRSWRPVLESARQAAERYRSAIQQKR